MKMHMISSGFSSLEEYDNYKKCVSRLKVGDEGEIYIYDTYPVPKSICSRVEREPVKIIALDQYNTLLIGSNNPNIGFWPTNEQLDDTRIVQSIDNYRAYKFAWWSYLDQIRFASIKRSR